MLVVKMDKWNNAQEKELIFWKAKWDFPVLYKIKYNCFLNVIESFDKNSNVLDIGCGAYTFSGLFGFKNLWLIDSLMESYRNVNNNLLYSSAQISCPVEDVLCKFRDNIFDIVFFLNCADHINPDSLEYIFIELRRILHFSGKLFFYSDFRNNEKECDECHPFIFTKQDYDKLTLKFQKIFTFTGKSNEKDLGAIWSIMI